MNQKATDAILQIMETATKTHPLFLGQDAGKTQEISDAVVNSMQAMFAPDGDGLRQWTENWVTYQSEMTKLWVNSFSGSQETATKTRKDRRFGADEWDEGIFPFLHQSYELTAKAMVDMAEKIGLPDHEQRKLNFYARVMADGLSPSNYALTNPEVLKLAAESNGQSFVDGFKNLLADLEKGYLSTTDETAFKVGENLATTPGAVVFRNDLIEVIQYTPMTQKVQANPILIIPPCVNKFYIFDINEKKSMVRYLLEEGSEVFMISWRNPGPEMAGYDWNDYIETGIMAAIDATTTVSTGKKVDLLSWCNGGTMALAALAVMPAKQKSRVGTTTFLSSMIDFADPGEIEVFIDRPQVDAYNQRLKTTKVAHGRDIAQAMAMLHVNESIWGFVINNYLKGKSPAPFDILFWNADTSNLPTSWYSYYTEEMYMDNKLKEPGALTLLDTPVDTRNIDMPCYFVAATGDHIVPWKTSYDATQLVSGKTEFVLTDGGHVSGTVINHPVKSRRHFLSDGPRADTAEEWQGAAARTDGSWWPHWLAWLDANSGAPQRDAPQTMGNSKLPVLAPAPGTFVFEDVAQNG